MLSDVYLPNTAFSRFTHLPNQTRRDPPQGKRDARKQQQQQRVRGTNRVADGEDDVLRVRELLLAFNGPYSTFAR